MVRECKGEYAIHHDNLKLCIDRAIPMWVLGIRHEMMGLDETIAYDEAEQDLAGQECGIV